MRLSDTRIKVGQYKVKGEGKDNRDENIHEWRKNRKPSIEKDPGEVEWLRVDRHRKDASIGTQWVASLM